jgi:uncharacterized protein (UPF0332 family)
VVTPEDLLAHAQKLLASASSEPDYRNVVERAYYSAYHAAAWLEEHLPYRSKVQPQRAGVHEALLQRLERPDERLDYGLKISSKSIGAELRMFKTLRELATYELTETIGIDKAEEAILKAKDILDDCNRSKPKLRS